MNVKKKNPEYRWRLLPLEGKYYGTRIQAPNGAIITLWGTGDDYRPSERELAEFTPEEIATPDFMTDYFFDNHHEQQGDLENARFMVAALNKLLD